MGGCGGEGNNLLFIIMVLSTERKCTFHIPGNKGVLVGFCLSQPKIHYKYVILTWK